MRAIAPVCWLMVGIAASCAPSVMNQAGSDAGTDDAAASERDCAVAEADVFAPALEDALNQLFPTILANIEGFYVAPTSMHRPLMETTFPWTVFGADEEDVSCVQTFYESGTRVKDNYFSWFPHAFIDDEYAKLLYTGEVAAADYDENGYRSVFAVGLPVRVGERDGLFFTVEEVSTPPTDHSSAWALGYEEGEEGMELTVFNATGLFTWWNEEQVNLP